MTYLYIFRSFQIGTSSNQCKLATRLRKILFGKRHFKKQRHKAKTYEERTQRQTGTYQHSMFELNDRQNGNHDTPPPPQIAVIFFLIFLKRGYFFRLKSYKVKLIIIYQYSLLGNRKQHTHTVYS